MENSPSTPVNAENTIQLTAVMRKVPYKQVRVSSGSWQVFSINNYQLPIFECVFAFEFCI